MSIRPLLIGCDLARPATGRVFYHAASTGHAPPVIEPAYREDLRNGTPNKDRRNDQSSNRPTPLIRSGVALIWPRRARDPRIGCLSRAAR